MARAIAVLLLVGAGAVPNDEPIRKDMRKRTEIRSLRRAVT